MKNAANSYDDIEAMYSSWPIGSIWDLFSKSASHFADNEFLVFDDGSRYTYKDIFKKSTSFIDRLYQIGVRPGTHVGVKIHLCPESIVLGFALNALGAIRVSINDSLGPIELTYQISRAEVEILITDTIPRFTRQNTPASLKRIVVVSKKKNNDIESFPLCESMSWEQMEKCDQGSIEIALSHDAYVVADIMFTSGGSSNPKAVPLTNDMLLRSAYASCLTRQFEERRRIYLPIPQCHVYAYVEGLLAALYIGGCLLMTSHNLAADEAMDFIKREQACDMITVPSIVMKYLDYLEVNPIEFPDLKHIYCSASVTPSWIWPALKKTFKVDDVITGYGMTEVTGATMQTRPHDSMAVLKSKVGTIQQAGAAGSKEYSGALVEYRVVDPDTGKDCSIGACGELWCRGLVVLSGYYNDDQANKDSFIEGWFRTGDIGCFDKEGYCNLKGKIGDSYKINGENVSTAFVESIVEKFDGAYHVEIVGIPHERLGAVGVAFVQLKDDSAEDRDGFEKYCRENLARHQIPKYYFYFSEDDWPLTPSGKVKKNELCIFASLHQ